MLAAFVHSLCTLPDDDRTGLFAASTVQHDAPTVRFYDARGNVTGSATRYGNQTRFYAPDGRLVGIATTRGR
jgi:YD repeat-containing protein